MAAGTGLSLTASWPTDKDDELSCKYAGEFFATWMTTPEQIKANTYRGPGLAVTPGYLRVLTNTVGDKSFTDGQLLQWFADEQAEAEAQAQASGDAATVQFNKDFIQPALDNCGASVCKSLGWTGNADLAGIGVFASYYIEAGLATIFFIVLLASRLSGRKTFSQRLLRPFREALKGLRLSIYLFSFVVMCASLNSIVKAQNNPLEVTSYEIITAILVTIFSMCPATLSYNMGEHTKVSEKLQLFVLFVLWAFMLVVVNLGIKTDPSKTLVQSGQVGNPFEVYCPVIGSGPLEAVRIFAAAASGLALLWFLFLALYKCLRLGETKGLRSFREKGWVWISLLAWIAMWVFLGVFTALRARIIEVAGDSDKSNEWGFGQIIAVTAWAPVVLEFCFALFSPSTHGAGEEGGGNETKGSSGVKTGEVGD